MKKKELEKVKGMSLKELRKEIIAQKRKFVEVSAKIQAGKEKNLKAGKAIRAQIARMATLIGNKEKEPVKVVETKEEKK